MIHKYLLAFLCLGAVLLFSTASTAQAPSANRYNSGFVLDEDGVPYTNRYYKGLPKDNVIALVRKPELTEDQFILRITNPYVMNGCVDFGNYGYEAAYQDIYLDITLSGLVVDMRKLPQYAHYECDQASQQPVADIILNRQDLAKNETKQIRMHNGTDTNYYNIIMNDHKVMILPDEAHAVLAKKFKPHEIPGRKTSLVYWFYPVGTVLLWVPGMGDSEEAAAKLEGFAKTRGLVPLETVYPEFKSPLTKSNYHYFVDTSGHWDAQQAALQEGIPVGTVRMPKKVFGLEKDEIVLDEMTVYAKLPGMYE